MSFFKEIQTNDNVRNYLLTDLATYLCGVNKREKFRFWLGSGGNGKSKLIELLNSAFGEYSIKFPITLITGKRLLKNISTFIIKSGVFILLYSIGKLILNMFMKQNLNKQQHNFLVTENILYIKTDYNII